MNNNQKIHAMFYAITQNFSQEPGMIKVEDDIKGFNVYRFADEAKLIIDWPDGIVFFIEGDRIDDYWKPRLLWNVVSDKVRSVILKHNIQGVQLLPVTVVHRLTGMSYQYWTLNVFESVDALRRKYIQNLDIFRVRRNPDIYISSRLKENLERAGATGGFGFRPVSEHTLDKPIN